MDALFEGKDTLTQSDLDDFKRRLGERSPTAADAMAFTVLTRTLSKFMSDRDESQYYQCVMIAKGKAPGDKEQATREVARLEAKALTRTPSDLAHIKERRDRSKAKVDGIKRVREKTSGRKGKIGGYQQHGSTQKVRFMILFDEEVDNDPLKFSWFGMDDVAVLCAECDSDANKKCSRCKAAWYCSEDCQRNAWATHKKSCSSMKK